MRNSTFCRIILTGFLCITLSAARAQYVAIPDTNFGNWLLNNGYSSCLTGNSTSGFSLDTACSIVTSAITVNCNYSAIHDLTGIQYFHNITSLSCDQDSLTSLPVLPAGLTYLDCDKNSLTSLPVLPAALTALQCEYNQLTSLPALPSWLTVLICNQNSLTSLPALPAGLESLQCGYNQLTSLPALPASLEILYCGYNQLTSLPALPAGLTDLECDQNPLTSLPALPAWLETLQCEYNQLTSLPALPAGFKNLDCSWNQLSSLPVLPATLAYLKCSWNQLSSLPVLPAMLTYLDCSHDSSLACLPRIFQDSLYLFYISGTQITCLPNAFSAQFYDINPDTMPLSAPASGCDFYYNIAGNVHSDTATTCQNDNLYPGSPITDLKVELLQNGQVVQQFYTFNSGNYSFDVSNYTNYTVSIDTTGLPLSVVCPASDTQYVALSAADTVATQVNFGMQCSNFDYGVEYIWGHHFRPTSTTHVQIGAGNIVRLQHSIDCGAGMPGTVTTALAGSITYISPAPGALTPTSVSGSTLTYTLTDLDSLIYGSLDIIVLTDTGAVAGTDACFTTIITPATPDMNPNDDTLTACFTIVNSWDPNSKTVTPTTLSPAGGWLTYTVEFQNTGTDNAYTVVVRDTLSQYVDASSFQYLGSSAKSVIQLFGNAMVFTFPKINLPDSAENPTGSEGWIQYKVKTLPNLPINTQVKNTAYVYFDNNPAVVTNTTINTVDTPIGPLGVKSIATSTIHLYPNPNKGSFTLQSSNNIGCEYTISDMLGNIITQHIINSDTQEINLPEAEEGVYTLAVQGSQPVRFVIVR